MVNINIGSINKIKIEAVEEVIQCYHFLTGAKINSLDIQSSVSEQPKSIKETVEGAINRAKKSFQDCNYSFGIESGLIEVPYTKKGFLKATVCVIYDGKEFHLGISPAFECPKNITDLILEKGINLSEACYKLGLTKDPNLGQAEGIIGILTKGRVTRKDYTKQAIIMALIHLENNLQ